MHRQTQISYHKVISFVDRVAPPVQLAPAGITRIDQTDCSATYRIASVHGTYELKLSASDAQAWAEFWAKGDEQALVQKAVMLNEFMLFGQHGFRPVRNIFIGKDSTYLQTSHNVIISHPDSLTHEMGHALMYTGVPTLYLQEITPAIGHADLLAYDSVPELFKKIFVIFAKDFLYYSIQDGLFNNRPGTGHPWDSMSEFFASAIHLYVDHPDRLQQFITDTPPQDSDRYSILAGFLRDQVFHGVGFGERNMPSQGDWRMTLAQYKADDIAGWCLAQLLHPSEKMNSHRDEPDTLKNVLAFLLFGHGGFVEIESLIRSINGDMHALSVLSNSTISAFIASPREQLDSLSDDLKQYFLSMLDDLSWLRLQYFDVLKKLGQTYSPEDLKRILASMKHEDLVLIYREIDRFSDNDEERASTAVVKRAILDYALKEDPQLSLKLFRGNP